VFLRLRCSSLRALLFVCLFAAASTAQAQQQDWFRTGTGLGRGENPASPSLISRRAPTPRNLTRHSFRKWVRDDLGFSGILDVVSPSFYPQSQPSVPSELRFVGLVRLPCERSLRGVWQSF